MIKYSVNVNIDPKAIKKRIMESVDESLPSLAEEVLKDCNDYAPTRYGVLTGTAPIATDLKPTISVDKTEHSATITYGAPYSSYVYKGLSKRGKPLKYTKQPNQKAQKEWCKKAKSLKSDKWKRLFQKLIMINFKHIGGK